MSIEPVPFNSQAAEEKNEFTSTDVKVSNDGHVQPYVKTDVSQPTTSVTSQPSADLAPSLRGFLKPGQRARTAVEAAVGLTIRSINSYTKEGRALIEKAGLADQLSNDVRKWRRRATKWEQKFRDAERVALNREPTPAKTDKLLHGRLSDLARDIPTSNGSRLQSPYPLRVAMVTDTYMYNFYKDSFALCEYLSPETYQQTLETGDFDLFIYVTCWAGVRNEEWRGIGYREMQTEALEGILKHFRTRDRPTVFQSIEDPSNFERFIPLAKQFDFVFTSDDDMLGRYRAETGHNRVFYGEYGANALINNPIGSRRTSLNAAFFAGSYPTRYEERCKDMQIMFDSIIESGGELIIADRNFGSSDFQYPETYRPYVIPPFEHQLLQRVHKVFRYSLNFNSIKASPTMCAMRVYELQAQGRQVLSNYARSVLNKFPEIRIVPSHADLFDCFRFPESAEDLRLASDAVRNVLSNRTAGETIGRMLQAIGVGLEQQPQPKVAVVVTDESSSIQSSVAVQRYPEILVVTRDQVDDEEVSRRWAAANKVALIATFSPALKYGPHYLQDMVNAFKYTDCDYVTVEATVDQTGEISGRMHDYVDVHRGAARTVFSTRSFTGPQVSGAQAPAVRPSGYAIDPWQVTPRSAGVSAVAVTPSRALSVVVPVFNNGRFLATKCIPSLQRNRGWSSIEVILVDDGSTDADTLTVCRELSTIHPNVRLYEYPMGGSGSASRPRNRGIEMATASLISFLDPDNEISPFGYDRLLENFDTLRKHVPELAFVSGYQVKVAETTNITGRHTSGGVLLVQDFHAHFFDKGKFPVISTQAAVIDRRLLLDRNLRFVEKAVGQDTLFGWELLWATGAGAFTADAFLVYYAERVTSVTNQIDARYFDKKIIMEEAQVRALEGVGLLARYASSHFDNFMREWYLRKIEQVAPEERQTSMKKLAYIAMLYGKDPVEFGLPVIDARVAALLSAASVDGEG